MPTIKKKETFADTWEGTEARRILQSMDIDKAFNTAPSYSANQDLYPNHQIPFVDKHMNYLSCHPSIEPKHYLANLRLMSRIKT